jgi:hypothetical protein
MKPISKKSGNSHVAFAKSSEKSSDHQPKRITLSMIEADLDDLTTDLQSLYAKITTSNYGVLTKAKSLFTASR